MTSDGRENRNRLADEPSLYLRQHGDNPVNWYPWGEEALALARAQDKPILLSIGYSSCHWCHVMAHECFENADIASLMNKLFVCIKVDREERPDLDNIYMKAVQMMTGRGGWPMTVFLRPDLSPYYAGTYFPPEDRGDMPAFPRVLVGVARAYKEKSAEVGERADHVVELLARGNEVGGSATRVSDQEIVDTAVKLAGVLDANHGGFGGAPKFPNTLGLSLLLDVERTGDPTATIAPLVKLALDEMADGGIYDHLGGGFHRYSVDRHWLVPHFEKMLYDQALLCDFYLEGWQRYGEPAYAETATGICDYLQREMVADSGGFYATQDADSEGVEGKFFVWSVDEVGEVVGADDAELVCRFYDITAAGNFEGRSILHRTLDETAVAELLGREIEDVRRVLARARVALLERRRGRVAPATDTKHLADWNGLMLGAMAKAGRAFDRADFVATALSAGDFVRDRMIKDDRLYHFAAGGECRVPGFLDDYAFFGRGCLEAFVAAGRPTDLDSARAAADTLIERFEDPRDGAFFFTADDADAPLLRSRDLMDSAVPSGNAVATELLLRLWQLTGEDRYRRSGERALDALLPTAVANPHGGAHTLAIARRHRRGFAVAVIAGSELDGGPALLRRALQLHNPELSVLAFHGEEPQWLPAPVRGKPAGRRALAYVCRGPSCSPPTDSPDELEALLHVG